MTKLPDEIERIAQIVDDYIASKDYYSANEMRELLTKHLIHRTDEGIEPTEKLLGVDHPANGDRGCKIYGYVEKGIAVITRVEYVNLPKEVEGIEKEEPTEEEIRMQIPAKKIVIHDTHDMPPTKEPNPTKETIQIEKIDENKWYGPGGSHANGAVEVCQKKINEIISVVNALQSKHQ